jgi:hypothetical protein
MAKILFYAAMVFITATWIRAFGNETTQAPIVIAMSTSGDARQDGEAQSFIVQQLQEQAEKARTAAEKQYYIRLVEAQLRMEASR